MAHDCTSRRWLSLVAFVAPCDARAGVWGSPFGSVAAAKIWLGRAPRRRAHASLVSKGAMKPLRDSSGAAAAASAAVRVGANID